MDLNALRFGVFYDGRWFSGLWRYLADHSAWRAAPTFLGVHDALRWYLYREFAHPLPAIHRVCAHYMLGRPAAVGERSTPANWETVLARFGIVRHDAPH
ncbi:MAG: hypothetical protein ACRDNL_00365, partial [Spirillospora sp.]